MRQHQNRFRGLIFLCCMMFLLISIPGLAKIRIDSKAFSSPPKIGLLSLSMDKVGAAEIEGNPLVWKTTLEYALSKYTNELANFPKWTLVPAETITGSEDVKQLTEVENSPAMRAYLEKLSRDADQGGIDFAFSLADMAEIMADKQSGFDLAFKKAAAKMQNAISGPQCKYVGAEGLPTLPYSFFVKKTNNTGKRTIEDAIIGYMTPAVVDLVKKLELDGLAIIYLHTRAGRDSKSLRVIMEGRTLGTIRMDSTILVISKDGKFILDGGEPRDDDLMVLKMEKPVILGETGETIDLNHPIVIKAYQEVVDGCVERLFKNLKKEFKIK
jgi:hypothetical protein